MFECDSGACRNNPKIQEKTQKEERKREKEEGRGRRKKIRKERT